MPSIGVSWKGQSHSQAVQHSLCSRMSEIYEVSARLFRGFFPAEITKEVWDGAAIPGKVLLSPYLFLSEPIPTNLEKADKELYATRDVSLFGIQFPLFDPRKFNSLAMLAHCDILSFVFLRSPDPGLDGRMVQVVKLDESKGEYPYLLTMPHLDLRYYLERWIGELLGWVKHFYVPNLIYWAWLENQGYAGYEQTAADDIQARDQIFFYLRDALEEEAKDWTAIARKYPPEVVPEDPPGSWLEIESERLDRLAQKEKRQRNHGT